MLTGDARDAPRLRASLLSLYCVFWCCWALAVIGIARDMHLPIDERWAGSAMLAIEGLIATLWAALTFSWRRAMAVAAAVLPLAFGVEYIGVRSGVPFGRYHYTGALVPRLFDIPLPITCAWMMIALGSLVIAARRGARWPWWAVILVSALLATALDACIEPTAVHLKAYWLWDETGRYYGVPLKNFAGWFVAAWIINACAAWALWGRRAPSFPVSPLIPMSLFWATVAMFAVIALFRGYPAATLIGVTLAVCGIAPAFRRGRHRRDAQSHRSAPSTRPARADTSGSRSAE
jgi:putative membrane protein